MTFISIIIPSFNEEQNIARCINSIYNCSYPKDKIEIILVDNGSKDQTVRIAKRLNVNVLIDKNKKISGLRNLGCKIAKGDIIGFVDADCSLNNNTIKNAVDILDDLYVGITGYCCIPPEKGNWIENAWGNHLLTAHGETGDVDYINSGNCFMRKEIFKLVGGFSETLETSEDTDICKKIRTIGFRVYQDKRISSIHWGYPKTLSAFMKREIWHGIGATNNIKRFWMSKSLILATYNLLLFFFLLISICLNKFNILFLLCLFFSPPVFLALKYFIKSRQIQFFSPLIILYAFYGTARSIALIRFFANKPANKVILL